MTTVYGAPVPISLPGWYTFYTTVDFEFDPANGQWRQRAPMPRERAVTTNTSAPPKSTDEVTTGTP